VSAATAHRCSAAASQARPALGPAGERIPVGRFLFGNDLPPVRVPPDGPVETLNALGLPEPDLKGIRWRNAARFCRLPLDG